MKQPEDGPAGVGEVQEPVQLVKPSEQNETHLQAAILLGQTGSDIKHGTDILMVIWFLEIKLGLDWAVNS